MENEVAVPKKMEMIVQIEKKLGTMLKEQVDAFPRGFNETKFLQNTLAVLKETKDIDKCEPNSIVRCLIKGAYLDLDFFRRECYAIPYKNKETGVMELNFQTDYKGEIRLSKKYGDNVKDIYAKLVHAGDDLEFGVKDGIQVLNFNPKPFNDGEIIGAFAVAVFNDGTTRYEAMSIKEIEIIRTQFSKAPDSPAWKKSYGEMCKKVVLRRLCKLIGLDFSNPEQQRAYEDGGDADLRKASETKKAPKVPDPFASPAAEAIQDAEVVVEKKDSNADRLLRAEFEKRYPGEEPWQIDIRIKEFKESAA